MPTEEHAARRWQAHVDARRIGTDPSTTTAQLVRHMQNEDALLGRARSLRVHVREGLKGRT